MVFEIICKFSAWDIQIIYFYRQGEKLLSGNSNYTDKELFLLIADGDETAFAILFHRFVPKIRPVLVSLIQSEAVAQDLIQDIFLGIWISRFKLTEIQEPSHWIFRIVYNRAYSWLEKNTVRQKVHRQISATQSPVPSAVEESVLFAETARHVKDAIDALPPQTRKIYQLSREQGLKNQEIADALQLSVNTVKNTLVNAGKAIKQYLERKGISLPVVLLVSFLKFFFRHH